MTVNDLIDLFEKHECTDLVWENQKCTVCGCAVTVTASIYEGATPDKPEIRITGGAVLKRKGVYLYKCPGCYEKDKVFRQECEVYSRVVGYLRPVKQWNPGKQAEFKARKTFDLKG